MHVFVTGANGFIGQSLVKDLLSHNHTVLGLARSDTAADTLSTLGAQVVRGDTSSISALQSSARTSDAVIHLAFSFDPEDIPHSCAVDQAAINALSDGLAGSGKPLVIASGTLLVPPGEEANEDTPAATEGPASFRAASETLAFRLSREKGFRASSVRLAPTVHGVGDVGFIPILAGMAKNNGFVTTVPGTPHWPAVHRDDAATLFRLAMEKGKDGKGYIGAAECAPNRLVMEAIAKRIGLSVVEKSVQEAGELCGFFGFAMAMDNVVSNEGTKRELGWSPTQCSIVQDIEENYTF